MEEVTNTRFICIGCDDDFQMKWVKKIIDALMEISYLL